MVLTKNKTTATTKHQGFPLDYRGSTVYISFVIYPKKPDEDWYGSVELLKLPSIHYVVWSVLAVVFLKMCFVKMEINFELLKLMIFFDLCYRNKPKNLSLNFIRLLRVVITPSVSKCWEEKTTRSNRMKFRLKNPGLLWQTVVGRAEHVHLINFTLPFSR